MKTYRIPFKAASVERFWTVLSVMVVVSDLGSKWYENLSSDKANKNDVCMFVPPWDELLPHQVVPPELTQDQPSGGSICSEVPILRTRSVTHAAS